MLGRNAAYNDAEVGKIPMVIPKGHMSFHHCRDLPRQRPQPEWPPRRAISLHLQDGDNASVGSGEPGGSLLAYNHDVVVRKTSEGTPDYSDPEYCPVLWRS